MNRLLAFLIFTNLTTQLFAQSCKCDSLFLQTQKIVETNYAGWFDKVNKTNKEEYDNWTKMYFEQSKNISTDSVCAKTLQSWITFFKDKHLRIKFTQPKQNQQTSKKSNEPEILKTNLSEKQIEEYLAKQKKLDPIEGIYKSSSYKLGITRAKANLFYATIISTSNSNWKPGEVKLTIKKVNNSYRGSFYEGDKSDQSDHAVKLVDNILDFDIVFFEKISSTLKRKLDIIEYEMSKDKYAPSLTFKNNDLAIFTFPGFENNSSEQLEYLLKKYSSQLEKTPFFIIDLRNNSGGDYSIGMQLLKYFYSKPIIQYNREMRMTTENFDMWFNSYVKDTYDGLDEKNKKKYDEYFDKMKANYGKLYNPDGKMTDTTIIETTLINPKKIAVLIDSNTVSSGELFTMLIRQSDKVTVFGTNSGGMMDYGNIVWYKTNYPAIRVQLPMDRELWLDTGYSVDKEGLKPDIYLTGNNWIEKVYKTLKK